MADEPAGEDEFALIARHFAPLARTPSARGLIDDVALLTQTGDLVVTADAIVEGVHFLADDPPDLIARKALRVNVSDLVAKGAAPRFYLMALVWPDGRLAAQLADFARGLGEDQALYDLALLGGDTTRTPGPLTVAITMFGAPLGNTPARAGAQVGDDVWVSGTIGDADLGLMARRGRIEGLDATMCAWLARRYQVPEPRIELAPLIAAHAHASCDVSDGLFADAGKIANASGIAIEIAIDAVPLSAPARAWVGADQARLIRLASGWREGGDDYEILFTAPASARAGLADAARGLGQQITRIGRVIEGAGARLIGASGPIDLAGAGHAHRLGAGAR